LAARTAKPDRPVADHRHRVPSFTRAQIAAWPVAITSESVSSERIIVRVTVARNENEGPVGEWYSHGLPCPHLRSSGTYR
jgi:hypothetical protein